MSTGGSLFDIVGPVMVGPSSSHTAGAVRLGQLARQVAGQSLRQATLHLYNSFAETYRGHGTDRGLIAGLLGYAVNDDRIRTVLEQPALLQPDGTPLQANIQPETGPNKYSPNTVVFAMHLCNGEPLTVVGHSLGGGKVYISRINDFHVSLKGELPTLILFYKDQPGMIWQVTKVIAEHQINIATLNCSRLQRGIRAFMSITLDTALPPEAVLAVRAIGEVYEVRHVDPLPD